MNLRGREVYAVSGRGTRPNHSGSGYANLNRHEFSTGTSMPDLIVQFDCANPGNRAEEFQHHLVDRRFRVQPEVQGSEIWLNFQNIQGDMMKRIVREAHPWCLDRGLSLMQSSGEGGPSQATVLLIADLTKVVD